MHSTCWLSLRSQISKVSQEFPRFNHQVTAGVSMTSSSSKKGLPASQTMCPACSTHLHQGHIVMVPCSASYPSCNPRPLAVSYASTAGRLTRRKRRSFHHQDTTRTVFLRVPTELRIEIYQVLPLYDVIIRYPIWPVQFCIVARREGKMNTTWNDILSDSHAIDSMIKRGSIYCTEKSCLLLSYGIIAA